MRRILPVLGLCALAFAVDSQPASAEITYPWCAGTADRGHALSIGPKTAVSPAAAGAAAAVLGGYCEVNAMYRGPQPGMIPPPPGPARRYGY
jgi:hypothetical protein